MEILKSIYGYPKIGMYFRISIIYLRISLNHKKIIFIKEIGKIFKNECRISLYLIMEPIYGYPKSELWISLIQDFFWIYLNKLI